MPRVTAVQKNHLDLGFWLLRFPVTRASGFGTDLDPCSCRLHLRLPSTAWFICLFISIQSPSAMVLSASILDSMSSGHPSHTIQLQRNERNTSCPVRRYDCML